MTHITIPPELAADVAARPDRYEPGVDVGAEVLNLDDGDICLALGTERIDGQAILHVERAGIASSYLQAWALVGSVDGGPRPEPGQRVLVLAVTGTGGALAGCVGYAIDTEPDDEPVVVAADGVFAAAARWALLPDAAEPDAAPAGAIGADGDLVCGSPAPMVTWGGTVDSACTFPPGHPPIVEGDGTAWAHGVRGDTLRWTGNADLVAGRPTDAAEGPPAWRALPAEERARWRSGQPTFGDVLRAQDRQREVAASVLRVCRCEGGIPEGRWRVGTHAPRNIWIGPPGGGIDVGRMDTEELAALVVACVNADRDGAVAQRDAAVAELNAARDERDRYRATLVRIAETRYDASDVDNGRLVDQLVHDARQALGAVDPAASQRYRPSMTTSSGPSRPPKSTASKSELVDYATTVGVDRNQAEQMTKDDLNTHLDQITADASPTTPGQPGPTPTPGNPGQPQS